MASSIPPSRSGDSSSPPVPPKHNDPQQRVVQAVERGLGAAASSKHQDSKVRQLGVETALTVDEEAVLKILQDQNLVALHEVLSNEPGRLSSQVIQVARHHGYLKELLGPAAREGHLATVQFLLDKDRFIGIAHLGQAICDAAGNGHFEIVRILLQASKTMERVGLATFILQKCKVKDIMNPEAFEQSVCKAAENGHLEIVRFLLSEVKHLSPQGFETAVHQAFMSGHLEVARCLSTTGHIPQRVLEDMIFGPSPPPPCLFKSFETVSFLLGKTVSKGWVEISVHMAARENRLDLVKFLLSEGRTMSQDSLDDCMYCAVMNDPPRFELLQFLLSGGRTINQSRLTEFVCNSAARGHLDIVKYLLSGGRTINSAEAGAAVTDVLDVKEGHVDEKSLLEIVKFLLREHRFESAHIGSGIDIAIRNGHLDIARFLLSENKIRGLSRSDVQRSIEQAIRKNRPADIVELVLHHAITFTARDRDFLISLAEELNRTKIVHILERAREMQNSKPLRGRSQR